MPRRFRRSAALEDDAYESDEPWGPPFRQPRLLPHLVVIVAVAAGGLAAIHYFGGARSWEKFIQQLAAPVGCVWLLLTLAWYAAVVYHNRLLSCLCGGGWLLLTLAGNGWVAEELCASLERPYFSLAPLEGPRFDVVLVLGGGSDSTPTGRPQLSSRGDRLALAAQLFHAGKVERVVVSGVRWNQAPGSRGLAEESALLLQQLGVPSAQIAQLPTGADTSQEIQAFAQWLQDSPVAASGASPTPPQNSAESAAADADSTLAVGLLTSAWHLRRTMLLAERYGVAARPIPADFLSGPTASDPGWIVPTAANLQVSQLALRELLGYWLDR